MRERESINKRALKANIAAFIVTALGLVIPWAATKSINVWEIGIWDGIQSYLIALIVAAFPLRWRLFDRWEGANYARTLSIMFCIRAAIDIMILSTYSNIASVITPTAIVTAIFALFALICIKTPKVLEKMRTEEEEELEHYAY
ncbi:MAG: hypothetical protein K6F57_03075 [Candidatus Saccharibacteria bacterium]|nr:hypothetical protein [Candidatus Saccharibacteria bacterium]